MAFSALPLLGLQRVPSQVGRDCRDFTRQLCKIAAPLARSAGDLDVSSHGCPRGVPPVGNFSRFLGGARPRCEPFAGALPARGMAVLVEKYAVKAEHPGGGCWWCGSAVCPPPPQPAASGEFVTEVTPVLYWADILKNTFAVDEFL